MSDRPTRGGTIAGARAHDPAANRRNARLVGWWLLLLAGMILVMIGLGGATRLTGSGLSIMEWAPLSGVIPPLSTAEWERLFRLYQEIPQYALVNKGFSLADFQGIFWLEWVHRLWGRLMGVAFAGPLIWFWLTGRIERRLLPGLLGLFLLGGLQGAVGWFMVASGFFPDSTAVSPYRLVVHLVLALVLYGALIWTGLSVLYPGSRPARRAAGLRGCAQVSFVLIALTIVAGGFVAGTHAGLDYNTFPLMDGHLVPEGYVSSLPFWRNITQNIAAVQFDHRLLATLSALSVLVTLIVGFRQPATVASRPQLIALGLVTATQYTLGVLTLLFMVPTALATAHQVCAAVLLGTILVLLHAMRRGTVLQEERRGTGSRGPYAE